MLVRAARQKVHPDVVRHRLSSDQLYLPWLYPNYSSHCRYQLRRIAIDAGPQGPKFRKRRNSNDVNNIVPRRSLATAVSYRLPDDVPSDLSSRQTLNSSTRYRPEDDIPFESFKNGQPPSSQSQFDGIPALSNIKTFDYTSPLNLGGSLATAPRRIRNGRAGVGGELSEILSVLDACLQVGRIERAGVIMRRIHKIAVLGPEDMVKLHNRYLRAAVEQLWMRPSVSATQALHTWFELEIRRRTLPFDADTVAYMLKASLQSPDIDQRNRLVRRYMDMVQGDHGLEVLGLDILNAKELNQITHICPTYNLAEGLGIECYTEEVNAAEDVDDHEPTNQDFTVPNVRPMAQKGLGLKSLKKSLSLFSERPADVMDMESLTAEEKRGFQAKLEEDAVNAAIDRWRDENANLTKMGLNTSLQTKSLGARMWRWQVALEKALEEELLKVDQAEVAEKKSNLDMERCQYGPFLRILPTDKLAAVTILACMGTFSSLGTDKGLALSQAIMSIAHSVEEESLFVLMQNAAKISIWGNSKRRGEKNRLTPELFRKAMRLRGVTPNTTGDVKAPLDEESIANLLADKQWPSTIKAKVGAFLMSALIETAKIPVVLEHPDTKEAITQLQPAFSHSHQYKMGRKMGIVVANKVLVKQMLREPVHSLLAKHLPMLVEPEPWTSFNKGGFISSPTKVMRVKLGDKDQRHYAEAAIDNGDMEQTFKGLDVLGKTSWRINQPVFDIMLEAWNTGEPIANIPAENPKFEIPPEPEASKDPLERRRWIREVKLVENARSGLHSQRCFQNFQLEIARALRNEVFYFPHNIDFRGRAYPIPPYLNHMGADHCRGLMIFGKGKELGDSGLRWLKIQLANVFGFDKASLKEREDFTTENISNIYDSASKPLDGSRWWLKAEDPWQCLAACIELKNALESPDPTKFVSHLPVHQDGTCNGLQHYAALGGDSWGAKQVNLEPGDRPADVYSAVANLVKESIAQDLKSDNPYAKVLDGRINRKIVKQTVMTNVYGVTYIGAKAQVRKQLVAAYDDLPTDATINAGSLSAYIATKIFAALSSMFRGAHDIQYWLGECASRISECLTSEQLDRLESGISLTSRSKPSGAKDKGVSGSFDSPDQFKSCVIWTNPLHMPVVQPYRVSKSKVVYTNMQRLSLSEPHRSDPVSKRKQLQGFPPNFIHSLDATHMLLSALKCDEKGLAFAAVHDSFWTHASDIDAMNGVLRDAFIRIHSEDVIGRLAAEFAARYKGSMYLARVRSGSPLYEKLRIFRESAPKKRTAKETRLEELLIERKRVKLLASSDPKEVEEGKKMVTPGSLFEEMAGEVDLAPENGLEGVAIGDISTRDVRLQATEHIEMGDTSIIEEVSNSLPAGTPSDLAMGADSDAIVDASEVDAEEAFDSPEESKDVFEKTLHKVNRKVAAPTLVWLPLTFPPVPKKGEFDVSRLRESAYFFS